MGQSSSGEASSTEDALRRDLQRISTTSQRVLREEARKETLQALQETERVIFESVDTKIEGREITGQAFWGQGGGASNE